MIKSLRIYTDFNDDKIYAYCTYSLHRNRGKHIEYFKIELHYTDRVTGQDEYTPGQPVYNLTLSQKIVPDQSNRYKEATFEYNSHGYDQHTILDFIGDCPEHRDFLKQVGIHD